MKLNHLKQLFTRDLEKLIVEISAYENQDDIWKTAPGISNSAGNLALHICGNLRHFLGAVLGNDGYLRNRDSEFQTKDIPADQLIAEAKVTISVVNQVMTFLPEESLNEIYPVELFGKPMTTGFFFIHLYGHLNYHLGQVNYHRRLLTS